MQGTDWARGGTGCGAAGAFVRRVVIACGGVVKKFADACGGGVI